MSDSLPIGLPVRGNPSNIHIKAKHLGSFTGSCPAYQNVDSRPNVWPDVAGWRPEYDPHPFMLGAVRRAIEAIAAGDSREVAVAAALQTQSRDGVGLHPGVAVWVEHAIRAYLDADESLCAELGAMQLKPERRMEGAGRTLSAWGLWYDAEDGSVREVRRTRIGSARGRSVDDRAWAQVAAKLAVDGTADGELGPGQPPPRIRVVEVGLADASVHVTFDGTPAQARDAFATDVVPKIRSVMSGAAQRPGWDCARCRWVTACPSVRHVRGLLGQPRYVKPARSVSASDLDRYSICPSLYFLRSHAFLPAQPGQGIAQQRGIAVHRWLAAAHGRPGHPGCTNHDLPISYGEPGVHRGVLTQEEYKAARPYLAQHIAEGCPLGFGDTANVRVETRYSVYDPDANVLVAATPDLTYTAGGQHIWRETKSTSRPLPVDEFDALETYLAAAIDLLLLHDRVPDGGDDAEDALDGVLELEVLRAEDRRLYLFDTRDAELVSVARKTLATAAYGWHDDRTFTAKPGPACGWCPVRHWCPSKAVDGHGQNLEDSRRDVLDALTDHGQLDPF